jgi:transposase-like protein
MKISEPETYQNENTSVGVHHLAKHGRPLALSGSKISFAPCLIAQTIGLASLAKVDDELQERRIREMRKLNTTLANSTTKDTVSNKTTRKQRSGINRDYPSAAASLGEGLEECFTINRLGVPPSLHRCLATTNIIESPHAGVRIRTRRVCHWQNGAMVRRWMASAFLRTEKRFNKIMGFRNLWALESILCGSRSATRQAVA